MMSVGAVCAADEISDNITTNGGQENVYVSSENSFTDLDNEIKNADTSLDLTQDYLFNNESDNNTGIAISKDNFVLNGNGRTIDGNNQSRIFNITGKNITLNDLILINANADEGGAIWVNGTLTLNNITFINNYATNEGGAVGLYSDSILNCSNSRFRDNYAKEGSSVYVNESELNVYNAEISSRIFNKYGQIAALKESTISIENTTFANTTSSYATAIWIKKSNARIINSKFINLKANVTAGAIGIKLRSKIDIENCEFINVTSSRNGGAIFADLYNNNLGGLGSMTITDTVFKDTSSEFGGALLQLSGNLCMNSTEFINTHATYNGGAIYSSYGEQFIYNCTFDSGSVEIIEGYPTYGGAIYHDSTSLTINNSKFFNNMASAGSAITTYDSPYKIENTIFENNTNPIYTFFDGECNLENNTYINDDNISTNNTYFETIIIGEDLQFTLLNNTINVTTPPSRFDLRDWGWVSPVRNQGHMGSCWTFGMTGTLESALLKAAGITTDFSENNMQNTMITYSIYGDKDLDEGGANIIGAAYLLSWLGAFTQDADTYDEMGKISPLITTNKDIHVQDIMFTPNNEIPNGTQLKEAIMKYGSIDVSYFAEKYFYNPETFAHYVDEDDISPDHEVSIVGWDDNFPKEKFKITPPGDGAWIVKNSWGTEWGDNGYFYISYYDKTLLEYSPGGLVNYATSIIIENTEPYNKNYQYDLEWRGLFSSSQGNASYYNVFESIDKDLIAAVGTYFNQSDVDYIVEIFVNDELKLTQTGISPYIGYHTIKLNEYIPIKKGDIFKAKITSNAIPIVEKERSRVHYTENLSFISVDGVNWKDGYKLGQIACLKVYTLDLPIYTQDLVKIYKNDSKFEANIGAANETVTFEINGKNYTRTSDENGTASIAINLGPGNYTIKTTFNGTTVENTITVLSTLMADNLVKYYRNASQFYIDLIDGEGNPVSGVNITMNINGVFYNRTTNENGTARLNINLPPGEYILTALDPLTSLQMSYNITVLPTLYASDLEMSYKDGSTFNATVLDGQGNPLKDATVKFNINGIFYNRKTNSNGIAMLNITLMSGKYIITSEYDGLKVSNTIIIKD